MRKFYFKVIVWFAYCSRGFQLLLVAGMLLGLNSCYPFFWPFSWDEKIGDDWHFKCTRMVVNRMERDVVMTFFTGQHIWFENIGQDSTLYLDRETYISHECIPFDYLNAGVDSVVIYSKDAGRLCAWRNLEESGEGRQFFQEDSWKVRVWEEERTTNYEITFELLPADTRNQISVENDEMNA